MKAQSGMKKRKLSARLADFQMCTNCRIVDKDKDRCRVGHECPVCKVPSEGGMMYFNTSVHILVDLIEEAYHSEWTIFEEETEITSETDAHYISVLLFFCTLRELLMNELIGQLCWVQHIPKRVYKLLLADNRNHSQRQDNLLPSLTGKRWNELIKETKGNPIIDYLKMNDFIKRAVTERNNFMHEGQKERIDSKMAEECIDNIWPMLNFYIEIHNKYVHPHCIKNGNS